MSKRILVVEDQEDNRQILRDLLGSASYEVIEAEDGQAALAMVKRQRPDLILMDIQLPLMDGYEATRRFKADPDLQSIPIIVVTSYALSGDEEKERAAGCDGYVQNRSARVSFWRRLRSICRERAWAAVFIPFVPSRQGSEPGALGQHRRCPWCLSISFSPSRRKGKRQSGLTAMNKPARILI